MTGYHTYKTCIDACLQCAAICNHCASSCTQEENIKMMAGCIQLDMECAAICKACGAVRQQSRSFRASAAGSNNKARDGNVAA